MFWCYYYYYYYVEFSTGIFPGEKYPVKSHPETSDFQHFSEDVIIIIISSSIIIKLQHSWGRHKNVIHPEFL